MIRLNLAEILWIKRLSQKQFCDMTGFNTIYVNKLYHNKTTRIELDKLEIICKVLNITPNELIMIE